MPLSTDTCDMSNSAIIWLGAVLDIPGKPRYVNIDKSAEVFCENLIRNRKVNITNSKALGLSCFKIQFSLVGWQQN